MAKHPEQPLPGLPLLFAQRLAQVRQPQELMGESALPERGAAHSPAAEPSRKGHLNRSRSLALKAIHQSEIIRGAADQPFGWLRQQPFARAVDQAQLLAIVEGEDGEVDF